MANPSVQPGLHALRLLLTLCLALSRVCAGPTCYSAPGVVVSNCTCDASCATCGYTPSPTRPVDCVTCPVGTVINSIFTDRTGFCAPANVSTLPRTGTCYSAPGATISGCSCFPSCATCGYYSTPSSPADCVTCMSAYPRLTSMYTDGTGVCTPALPPVTSGGLKISTLCATLLVGVAIFVCVA